MVKKKKAKKAEALHDQHHQMIHDYIVERVQMEHGPAHHHSIPVAQPWHMPNPLCWCRPKKINTHPMTGVTTWAHTRIIH